ncbi:uncharacterized protein [Epargyreus clarus]|uniref:uncharacterized protein n=1 Tax=Epargyreus clarus TaxID=520877 RepID=UPI003C2C0E75
MPEVRIEEVERFMVESLVAAGAPRSEAQAQAELLLHADTVGHFSHGLHRLKLYINDMQTGGAKADIKPVVLKESVATAWVDGRQALGATVGNFCMELAIKKAKECGVGWVVAKHCNHFGMAGFWALKAEREGLIGMAFTNSSPIGVPTRAKNSATGTNPVAMAAPASGGDSLVVDMATTATAMGKIELKIQKGEPIPEGWALGQDGKCTTNAQEAFDAGRLLPLGGFESTSGYKGFALSAMIEVFCTGLSGSRLTHKVRRWSFSQTEASDLGQCYVAINPDCFAPGLGDRLAECLNHWRNMEPVDPSLPVLAPGDKEKNNAEVTKKRGTIIYPQEQMEIYARVADRLGVEPLEFKLLLRQFNMPEVRIEEVERFMVESLVAAGAPRSEAQAQADLLLHADTVGHFSHGLNRLELYINDIQSGGTKAAADPVVLKESVATAWVDGCHALGATVGNFCMELAIKKAKESGVGWVVAKRCNHFGMAGFWALKAERQGLIGMAFTNSAPIGVPTRAKYSATGTNPIAMAAPASGGDSLVVDMATTTAAMGKIEMQIHKGEPIPEGWALGPDGKCTTNAQEAFDTGRLLPLGGFESTSGYKGFGLGCMVEAFCSGLSGSQISHKVPGWSFTQTEAPDLGQCFVVIDPGCFAPGFGDRLADCLNHWRNMEPVDPSLPVLAPGDKEKKNGDVTKKRGTIIYPQGQLDTYARMAARIGVEPLKVV